MDSGVEADRELLLATARRHEADLSSEVLFGLIAAADELIEPLVLPTLIHVDESATEQASSVVAEVRGRLQLAATSVEPSDVALACARAARELADVERAMAEER